jgi:hypothetical protein
MPNGIGFTGEFASYDDSFFVDQPELPRRFTAGADAVGMLEKKIALLQQQIEAHRELASSLAFGVSA